MHLIAVITRGNIFLVIVPLHHQQTICIQQLTVRCGRPGGSKNSKICRNRDVPLHRAFAFFLDSSSSRRPLGLSPSCAAPLFRRRGIKRSCLHHPGLPPTRRYHGPMAEVQLTAELLQEILLSCSTSSRCATRERGADSQSERQATDRAVIDDSLLICFIGPCTCARGERGVC